jgi:hypothetical protein
VISPRFTQRPGALSRAGSSVDMVRHHDANEQPIATAIIESHGLEDHFPCLRRQISAPALEREEVHTASGLPMGKVSPGDEKLLGNRAHTTKFSQWHPALLPVSPLPDHRQECRCHGEALRRTLNAAAHVTRDMRKSPFALALALAAVAPAQEGRNRAARRAARPLGVQGRSTAFPGRDPRRLPRQSVPRWPPGEPLRNGGRASHS